MTTVMWEAVAADLDGLLAWARAYDAEGLAAKEVYVSADDRVVIVAHWRDEGAADAADLTPPAGTTSRPPHAWRFSRVE
jgi:hypothetical protein